MISYEEAAAMIEKFAMPYREAIICREFARALRGKKIALSYRRKKRNQRGFIK